MPPSSSSSSSDTDYMDEKKQHTKHPTKSPLEKTKAFLFSFFYFLVALIVYWTGSNWMLLLTRLVEAEFLPPFPLKPEKDPTESVDSVDDGGPQSFRNPESKKPPQVCGRAILFQHVLQMDSWANWIVETKKKEKTLHVARYLLTILESALRFQYTVLQWEGNCLHHMYDWVTVLFGPILHVFVLLFASLFGLGYIAFEWFYQMGRLFDHYNTSNGTWDSSTFLSHTLHWMETLKSLALCCVFTFAFFVFFLPIGGLFCASTLLWTQASIFAHKFTMGDGVVGEGSEGDGREGSQDENVWTKDESSNGFVQLMQTTTRYFKLGIMAVSCLSILGIAFSKLGAKAGWIATGVLAFIYLGVFSSSIDIFKKPDETTGRNPSIISVDSQNSVNENEHRNQVEQFGGGGPQQQQGGKRQTPSPFSPPPLHSPLLPLKERLDQFMKWSQQRQNNRRRKQKSTVPMSFPTKRSSSSSSSWQGEYVNFF